MTSNFLTFLNTLDLLNEKTHPRFERTMELLDKAERTLEPLERELKGRRGVGVLL
jgi:hypothetical protein